MRRPVNQRPIMKDFKFIPFLAAVMISLSVDYTVNAQQKKESYLKEYNSVNRPATGSTLIENVRIIDGKGGKPIEKGYVEIKDGIITKVGQGAVPANQRTNAEIYNGEGKSILPGLMDAHLHTVNDNKTAQLFLSNGVTSFRDPGHPFTFYQSISFADKPLPRIFLTGAHLDYPPVAYGQQATLVKDNAHARKMVESHYMNGGTAIKIYFRLPLKFYKDVISTAKSHQIPVVAHLELVNAKDAIEAGINGIEHVTSFGTSIAENDISENFVRLVEQDNSARGNERYRLWASLNMDSPKIKEVIKLAKSKNVMLCPTLAAFEKQADKNSNEDYKVKGFQNMLKFVEIAHKEGLKIVIGSHTHAEYAPYGEAYFREMELLQMAGMTPLEILKSGTFTNAAYFGNSTRLGSVEVGKAADLIIVNGDPSTDLSVMRKINAIMLNGNWVKK